MRSSTATWTWYAAVWLLDNCTGLFCRFSRCFQVSNPCWAIHSTAVIHHIAL